MKRILLLGVVFAGLCVGALPAQEPKPAVSQRYRLFQVVEPSTLQQKVEEAAGDGYRLIQLVSAPGGSLAAIMEKAGSSSSLYQYRFRDLKFSQKISNEFSEQLSQFAAEGFYLHTILSPAPYKFKITTHVPSTLLVMEKPPRTPDRPQYEVLSPGLGGLGSFNQKKIASLTDQGYVMVQFAWLLKPVLIFEKRSASKDTIAATPLQQPAHPSQGYRFLVSRWNQFSIPEKEIQKAAREGSRVVAVIWLNENAVAAAMAETSSPSGPYEYIAMNPPHLNWAASKLKLEYSQIAEEGLNRAGEKGFRLFRQNSLFEPFLMEKVPGSTMRYYYRLMLFANLSAFSEQLDAASGQGYQVIAMSGLGDGFAAIMEKTESADIK